ncbi:MAG: lamin tail domain-containing protein [Verrucomicrobia bacterium]|nr:lamin tail domain-containing protein [Verrucomicrobiota bacterium]
MNTQHPPHPACDRGARPCPTLFPSPGLSRPGGLALWLALALAGATEHPATPQPAITEVMSSASTNWIDGAWAPCPDFWELTHLGLEPIDLSGWRFWDTDATAFFESATCLDHIMAPDELVMQPGETIVFVREGTHITNAPSFRAWWGETNLPDTVRIYFYPSPGFDDQGENLWLWDAHTNLMDRVRFGEATRGVSFTYDPGDGLFGRLSRVGECGAFPAATAPDIGSPGRAPCGPVALSIRRQSASQTVDAGRDVILSLEPAGLPYPRHQWFFNDLPIASAVPVSGNLPTVANFAGCGLAWRPSPQPMDLVLPGIRPSQAGPYYCVLSNALEQLTSAVVTLTVSTNLNPPSVECPPCEQRFPAAPGWPHTNLTVTPWQIATFAVLAAGYPPPTCQWSWSADGTRFQDLSDATNRTLTIPYVLSGHAGIYRVRLQNALGTTNVYAALSVQAPPRLMITEAFCQDVGFGSSDWWELTNLDDEPFCLYGCRWDDAPGNIGAGPTITNLVIIQPGESVILAEAQTRASFIERWGADNLPTGLQVLTYTANGLSGDGDEINLWNPTATADWDWITSVSFSTATPGSSFWFLPDDPCSEFGVVSIEGQCGAVRAAMSGDLGSPGWTPWTPPRLDRVDYRGSFAILSWKAQPGSTNLLQYADHLATPPAASVWVDLGTYCFASGTGAAVDALPPATHQRFYRLVRAAPAHCPCSH